MAAGLDSLPEELKLQIISHLDIQPPSLSWHTRQLSSVPAALDATSLKDLSLVSKKWRRLVNPVLFRCLRVKLDPASGPRSCQCRWSAKYRQVFAAITAKFKQRLFYANGFPRDLEWPYRHSWQDARSRRVDQWLTMIDSALGALSFIDDNGFPADIESLAIVSTEDISDAHPDSMRDEMHSLIASAAFWDVLFSAIEPRQLTLLAPPSTLACLLNCSVRLTDAWAFPGMSLQLVSLRRPFVQGNVAVRDMPYDQDDPITLRLDLNGTARPALASVVYIRPWTDLVVSEGSYIQAYSTYEYFHKEPPGILYPIAQAFEQRISIQAITYQAIFPFHDYLAATVNLMSTGIIRHLSVKIAPGDNDDVLTDPTQVGKADVTDCWGEVEQAYSYYMTSTADPHNEHTHLTAHSNLETFSSGDCGIQSIRDLLQRSFQLHEWEEIGEGKWAITEAAMERRRSIQSIYTSD